MKRVTNRIGVLLLIILLVAVVVLSVGKPSRVDRLPEDALIVDVRTAAEFRGARFPGAKNIPLGEMNARLVEFGPKDKPVVVYCRSGRRSVMAQVFLKIVGYEQVINGGGLGEMLPLAQARFAKGITTQ